MGYLDEYCTDILGKTILKIIDKVHQIQDKPTLKKEGNSPQKSAAEYESQIKALEDRIRVLEHEHEMKEAEIEALRAGPDEKGKQSTDGLVIENNVVKSFSGTDVDVLIPEGVVKIDDYAFRETRIHSVTLPESLEIIGEECFKNCTQLERINIPKGFKTAGSQMFSGCDGLKTAGTDKSCNIILNSEMKEIPRALFRDFTNIVSVNLPDEIISIEPYAFLNCKNLECITLPSKLKEISASMLCNCVKLKEIVIPYSVEKIGNYAFSNCRYLEEVVIPESVSELGEEIFNECFALKKVIIKGDIKKLEDRSLYIFCDDLPEIILNGNALKKLMDMAAKADKQKKEREEKERLKAIEDAKPKQTATNKEALHIFYDANQIALRKPDYNAILEQMEMKFKRLSEETDYWYETPDTISVKFYDSYFVWHDESVEIDAYVRIDRYEGDVPEREWKEMSEFPGAEQAVLMNINKDEGDRFSYTILVHREILIRNLYTLPGIWKWTEYYFKQR